MVIFGRTKQTIPIINKVQQLKVFSCLLLIILFAVFRLVRFNQRSRAITNIIAQIIPRIFSVFLLFLIVYYFFAVIGMQTFNGEVFKGCCKLVI